MIPKSEVARIAAGLTKAQRAALIRAGGYTATARSLFDAGLFGSISFDPKARYAFLARETERGRAVLAHLLQQDPSND